MFWESQQREFTLSNLFPTEATTSAQNNSKKQSETQNKRPNHMSLVQK